ncbi:MAG TPA: helix-turn-helix domain-containing protein, partial [Acidimicrobiia bacterium]|nr:helix-turn-helix domain-containing protein [Acidimicrobiia bacterium]
MTIPKLAGADTDDPAQGLQAVVVLRRTTERLEAIHVAAARA